MATGKRPSGRPRPQGVAVRRPGVRDSGLEGEGAKREPYLVRSKAKDELRRPTRRGVTHVSPRRGKRNDRPGPPVSDEGGVRQPKGRTNEQAGGASAGFSRSRRRLGEAREPVRPNEVRSLRERAMKKRPEGQGSQRAASVCRRPGAQHRVYAAERSVRWFCGRGAGPQRQRTGSPNGVRSAGTGERESTACWRDGPVAAQRSSGSSRRQEGVILTSPVPGASKRSEVAPGTGRLQRTKPEGQGGLAA